MEQCLGAVHVGLAGLDVALLLSELGLGCADDLVVFHETQEAVDRRCRVQRREPHRPGLAVEPSVALLQLTDVSGDESEAAGHEIIDLLTPFERSDSLSPRAAAILARVRRGPDEDEEASTGSRRY